MSYIYSFLNYVYKIIFRHSPFYLPPLPTGKIYFHKLPSFVIGVSVVLLCSSQLILHDRGHCDEFVPDLNLLSDLFCHRVCVVLGVQVGIDVVTSSTEGPIGTSQKS